MPSLNLRTGLFVNRMNFYSVELCHKKLSVFRTRKDDESTIAGGVEYFDSDEGSEEEFIRFKFLESFSAFSVVFRGVGEASARIQFPVLQLGTDLETILPTQDLG